MRLEDWPGAVWRFVLGVKPFSTGSTDGPTWLAAGKLDSVTTKAATGFTLLTGILTFFGIKEGLLDRILRTDPTAALWVFVLVGLGVLCALLAAAFHVGVLLHSFWLVVAIAFLGAVSLALFPNVRDIGVPGVTGGLAWTAAGLLLLCMVAGLVTRFALPMSVAVLLLGVAALSLGLYGGAKIAVVSKSAPESPRLTALLQHEESGTTLKVTVTAGQREGRPLVVVVRGAPRADGTAGAGDGDVVVGRVVMVGDATGKVEDTAVFPVEDERWSHLRVGYCSRKAPTDDVSWWRRVFGRQEDVDEQDGTRMCKSAADTRFKERVLLGLDPAPDLQVAATLTAPASGQLQAAVAAAAIPRGTVVHAQVVRQRAAERTTFATATLLPDAAGAASTTAAPLAVATGDTVSVCYRACRAGEKCEAEWTQVASTTVLAP